MMLMQETDIFPLKTFILQKYKLQNFFSRLLICIFTGLEKLLPKYFFLLRHSNINSSFFSASLIFCTKANTKIISTAIWGDFLSHNIFSCEATLWTAHVCLSVCLSLCLYVFMKVSIFWNDKNLLFQCT